MLLSAAANAQAASQLGASTLQQVCSALGSPLIVLVFVIAIVALVVTFVLGEGKGMGGRTVQIIVGAGAILGIGTIISMLGLTGNCSVL